MMRGDGGEIAHLIGERIRELRRERGLNQEEMSYRAGLHRTEISQLERGLRIPRIDPLIKVAASLEVSLEDWWAGSSGALASTGRAGSRSGHGRRPKEVRPSGAGDYDDMVDRFRANLLRCRRRAALEPRAARRAGRAAPHRDRAA